MTRDEFLILWPIIVFMLGTFGMWLVRRFDSDAKLVHDDNYDAALIQLALWIAHIESLDPVEVAEYSTGATGLQAVVSGVTAHALRFVRTDGAAE